MNKKRDAARLHRLTVREIQTAHEGDHSDGGGLTLRVTTTSAQWVLRYTAPSGKRREMGLGRADRTNTSLAGQNVALARHQAAQARALLQQGIDPIDAANAQREKARLCAEQAAAAKQAERRTLCRVAREYHEIAVEPNRSAKHSADWINSLEQHVPQAIWGAPIDRVTPQALLDFFVAIHKSHRETSRRVVQRLQRVFDHASFYGWCNGNPAKAASAKLRDLGIRQEVRPFRALPYTEAPAFFANLSKRTGIAARALEFAMLTVARTGEVLGATWDEFDLDACIWTVPADRMKGGQQHAVLFPPRARQILQEMRMHGQDYVFPSPSLNGKPLSTMAMLTVLNRMGLRDQTTVHGLCRSTFSTWANETAAARPDVIEACLAHSETDRVRAAYNRAEFQEERRDLLLDWQTYLCSRAKAKLPRRINDVTKVNSGASIAEIARTMGAMVN